MIKNLSVYKDIKSWKKPLHLSKAIIAKNYLKILPNLEVIAITGSVGKTLTQNALSSVLSQKYKVLVGEENLDPTFRIPSTILSAKPWHQKMILEYGVEHPGDMDHYLAIAQPKIAIMTRITSTHTKYFHDQQGVMTEKSKLFANLTNNSIAVLNSEDPYAKKIAGITKAKIIWFGKDAASGVKISHYEQNLQYSKFRMHYKGQRASVKWKVIGHHQLTSAYIAATIGVISGLTLKQVAKGLTQTKSPIHRLNIISNKKINIIDDTYNSSPAAAVEAINTLISVAKNKKKIAAMGQMKDLGKKSKLFHEELGKKIAKSKINILVTIGVKAKLIAESAIEAGFRGKVITKLNTRDTSIILKKYANSKSVILIKGSRHAHLERIVLDLLNKNTKINCYHCGFLD